MKPVYILYELVVSVHGHGLGGILNNLKLSHQNPMHLLRSPMCGVWTAMRVRVVAEDQLGY